MINYLTMHCQIYVESHDIYYLFVYLASVSGKQAKGASHIHRQFEGLPKKMKVKVKKGTKGPLYQANSLPARHNIRNSTQMRLITGRLPS